MKDAMLIFLTLINVGFTAVIAWFTYLVWKTYKQIEWLTGSMESYAMLTLAIEAKRGTATKKKPIKVVWWDPTIEKPPTTYRHGKEADLETIYIYVPPRYRKWRTSL